MSFPFLRTRQSLIASKYSINTAPNTLGISTNITAVSSANVTVNSYLGIGTTLPLESLHIQGDVYISSNITINNILQLQTSNYPIPSYNVVITNDGLTTPSISITQPNGSNAYLTIFSIGSNSLFTITNTGNNGFGTSIPLQPLHVIGQSYFSNNVGIGTIVPLQKLHVIGQSYFSSNVGIGTTLPLQQLNVVGQSYFSTNVGIGTTIPLRQIHIVGQSYFSSNVGIGTTIPLQPLHIVGKSYFSSNVGIGTTIPLQPLHIVGQSYFSSNVGIGTTIPLQRLHVVGQSYFSSNVGIGTTIALQPLHVVGQSIFSNNLGIGTTIPLYSLHVEGQSIFSSNLGIGTTIPIQRFNVIGKSYFSSNVGIGTNTPLGQLHLYIPSSNLNINTLNDNRMNVVSSILVPRDTSGNYSNIQSTYPANMYITNTITKPIMYSSFSPDNVNGSIYFSGNQGNYITLAPGGTSDSIFLNSPTSNYVIEGWVNYQSVPNVQIPNLFGRMSPTSNAIDWSFGMTSNQKLTFAYYSSNVLNIITSTSNIPLNQWNLINMTYNPSYNTFSLYINGLNNITTNKIGTPNYTLNLPITIGQQNNVPINAYISNLKNISSIITYKSSQQIGNKLVDNNTSTQGWSAALSSDGNTLAVGGIGDYGDIGATVIFTYSGGIWSQQGTKLVGTGYTTGNGIFQGYSVSLSSDGNTLAVGGNKDNSYTGATWIFTRSSSTWTQQGTKLVGTGYIGIPYQGSTVALSSDGNTLAVGGYYDNTGIGATWIFTRSGSTWTQQGTKLLGTGYSGAGPNQGSSVALSYDGNTLAIGSINDNPSIGATWIFIRSGSTWTQQGNKLVGTGYTGTQIYQGQSVALSSDGNTLAVSGYYDNSQIGATWIFTRSGTTWTQQGTKLVGTGYIGTQIYQGYSVSLSSDGITLAIGGYYDNSQIGATWIFSRLGSTWTQRGTKLLGTGYTGTTIQQGHSVALSSDGTILAVGGGGDNPTVSRGATWIFNNIYINNSNITFALNTVSSNAIGFNITNNGLVGIGIYQPQAMLHIVGNNQLVSNTNTTPLLNIVGQNGSALLVDAGGAIGIGTTNPQQSFQVQGQVYFASNVIIGNTTISSNILTVGGNILQNTGHLDTPEGVTAYRSQIPHLIPNIENTSKFLAWLQRTTTIGKTSWWSSVITPLYRAITLTISGTTNYYQGGGVNIPDGRVVFTPFSATNVGVFNTNTNTFTTYIGPPGTSAYVGSVLVPDGRVIFVPYSATTIGVFNPFTNTFSTPVTGGAWGSSAYGGGVLVPDGRVIFVPLSASTIGVFTPSTNSYSTISPTPTLPGSSAFMGGVLLPDGRVLFIPYSANVIGIFNPIGNTYSTIALPAQKASQYSGGVLLTDGRVLFVPSTGTTIGFFNYLTNTFSTFTPTSPVLPGTTSAQFDGGVLLPNGNVLFVPNSATSIWIFNPINNTYSVITPASPALPSGSSIFSGGLLLPDGRVVMIPSSQTAMGILSGFTRPPRELCYHPSFNKY